RAARRPWRRSIRVAAMSAATDARAGWPSRGRGAAARARVARLLWTREGERRVPGLAALDEALAALSTRDREWMFELSALGPVYFFPTAPWLRALAAKLRKLGARRILEVAAGDGFLSRSLRRIAPDLRIVASDS